jgi:hypothetical protein
VIEVGSDMDGFWPAQNRIEPLIAENRGILKDLLPRTLASLRRRLPSMPSITSPPNASPNDPFYLYWQSINSDTFNLPVNYRVTMLTGYSRGPQTFETTSGYALDGFTRTNSFHFSGAFSVFSGQGNNLRNSVTLSERLMVQPGDSLKFWARYNMENNYDYAYVEVSSDGGLTWWQLNGNLSSSQDPHRRNRGFGITGSTNGSWVPGIYPLRIYEGQEIKIRFAYWTDASVINDGFYLDDVSPCDLFSHSTVIANSIIPESLLVGPYPPGPRYFKVEARDDENQIGPPSNRYMVDVRGDIHVLTGNVRLSNSHGDLSGTVINLSPGALFDTTNFEGNYNITVIPGIYNIIASHPGYFPDTAFAVPIFGDTTANFNLEQSPPSPPALLQPANNANSDTEFVAFDWIDAPYAIGYLIEISNDSNFTTIVMMDSNLVISNYHNSVPFPNGTYFWRVTSYNQAGYSPGSQVRRFIINVILDAPRLIYPPNEFLSSSSYIDFSWTNVNRANHYLIEFSQDSLFTTIIRSDSTLTEPAYRNLVPFQIHPYYWRVTALGQGLISPRSEIRSFNLNIAIAVPLLRAPAREMLTNIPRIGFDWNDVVNAVSYVFEVSSDSLFVNRVVVDSVVSRSTDTSDFADGRYYWRVSAYNGLVYSERSERRAFNLLTYLPTPELISPAIGYVSDSNRVDFDWNDIAGANNYIIEVAVDSAFTDYVINDSSNISSAFPQAGPFANRSYLWRITATNGLIYSQRSNLQSFTVNYISSIQTPTLISPGNGWHSTSPYINFDWNDVENGNSYLFELSSDMQFTQMVIIDSALIVSNYSNAASLENGLYYWRIKARGGNRWSSYSDIWNFVVETGSIIIPGDANNSGTLNGLDVVFLVNYLKGLGPAPSPLLCGDANGSCSVNGLDVVYLVSYFKGGPPPYGGNCLLKSN